MKVLQLHCTEFSYRVTKETPVAEQPPYPKEGSHENALVCFTCYEKSDEGRETEIIRAYVDNVKTDTGRIGCKNVLLYPYAHLSHQLGSPRRAKQFLADLVEALEKEGFKRTGAEQRPEGADQPPEPGGTQPRLP